MIKKGKLRAIDTSDMVKKQAMKVMLLWMQINSYSFFTMHMHDAPLVNET